MEMTNSQEMAPNALKSSSSVLIIQVNLLQKELQAFFILNLLYLYL